MTTEEKIILVMFLKQSGFPDEIKEIVFESTLSKEIFIMVSAEKMKLSKQALADKYTKYLNGAVRDI